ncbi:hypothetical protein Droror1_Dr00015799 [Drosera rotundifolia]
MSPPLSTTLRFLLLILHTHTIFSDDRAALLSFLSQVPHQPRLAWPTTTPLCTWVGVTCDPTTNTTVRSLRLPAVGLVGPIPPDTLSRLSSLRVLSLRSNALSGPIPSDFSNLTSLRNLYLQDNEFSGQFPDSVVGLTALVRLDLSGNRFEGQIPFELNDLKDLTGLFLQRNNFSGELPSIDIERLVDFNVSENGLNGSIPRALRRFPASSFEGNLELCGPPLGACNSSFFPPPETPSPSPTVPSSPAQQSKRRLSTAGIVGIAVAGFVFILILLILLVLCLRKRSRPSGSNPPKTAAAVRGAEAGGTSSSKDDMTGGGGIDGERNKLVFLDDNAGGGEGGGAGSTTAAYRFDLEDLLRASAEVLGKGSVGTSYKAVLEEGTAVVVKRLKEVVAGKREFEAALEVLGRCRHDNVVAPRAYYYSKDEKLLVLEYLPAGSLSALLHGSRGSGRTPLDWESRVRVSLATARALTYLHVSNIIHGNIKASNILLRSSTTSSSTTFCVSDFGLNPLFGTASPPNRIAGYRAPEVLETRKVTPQSDVYSFGVLLLELLTGKAPNQSSFGDEGIDLPRWVQSVVREEWTAEVFDVELMRYNGVEDEMVQLLQVAMACVAIAPDQRPAMPEVLRMIEEVSRGESTTDDGMRQSSDEPSKGSDGHTPPAEIRTP